MKKINKKTILILSYVAVVVSVSFLVNSNVAHAANVYIDPTCSNPGNGSKGVCDSTTGDNPLKNWPDSFNANNDYYQKSGTISKTSVKRNIYSVNGNENNRIVFGAYYLNGNTEVIGVKGAKPILEETSKETNLFSIKNSDYLHFQNLDIRGGFKMISILGGMDHFLMEDCVVGKGTAQYGFFMHGGYNACDSKYPKGGNNYGEIRNTVFDFDPGTYGIDQIGTGGNLQDCLSFRAGTNYWKIHDNEFIDCAHVGLGLSTDSNCDKIDTSYNEIYDNYFHGTPAGKALKYQNRWGSIHGSEYSHHNKAYRNLIIGQASDSKLGGYKNEIFNNIFANFENVRNYRSLNTGIGLVGFGPGYVSIENKLYNNIFYDIPHAGVNVGVSDPEIAENAIRGNIIANNIIYNTGHGYNFGTPNALGTALWIRQSQQQTGPNKYFNNLIYNDFNNQPILYSYFTNRKTVDEFNAMNGEDGNTMQNNKSSNPLFVNPSAGDFSLKSGSP
ncbi:hypothetical protein ACFLY5_00395, partial [Patescibacteria group bacterium]